MIITLITDLIRYLELNFRIIRRFSICGHMKFLDKYLVNISNWGGIKRKWKIGGRERKFFALIYLHNFLALLIVQQTY